LLFRRVRAFNAWGRWPAWWRRIPFVFCYIPNFLSRSLASQCPPRLESEINRPKITLIEPWPEPFQLFVFETSFKPLISKCIHLARSTWKGNGHDCDRETLSTERSFEHLVRGVRLACVRLQQGDDHRYCVKHSRLGVGPSGVVFDRLKRKIRPDSLSSTLDHHPMKHDYKKLHPTRAGPEAKEGRAPSMSHTMSALLSDSWPSASSV
jgi:hypothetical protein